MIQKITIMILPGLVAGLLSAADFPKAEISNGQIRAKLYLPDAKNGYYKGTRFDWSGIISSLVYKGHEYYPQWYVRVDPSVRDVAYVGDDACVASTIALGGPVNEYQTNDNKGMGWDEAKPGETFLKFGIGMLRKDNAVYDHAKQYEIVNGGKWKSSVHSDSVEFTQVMSDPASGYGYVYRKIVRLIKNKPQLIMVCSIKNTGKNAIQGTVYNHNLMSIDKEPTGPDYTITVPFQIQTRRAPNKALAEIRGNQLLYVRPLASAETVATGFTGFSDSPKDNEVRIENSKLRAGVRFSSNRPLARLSLWSIKAVIGMEPFLALDIKPGAEYSWTSTWDYYVLPDSK